MVKSSQNSMIFIKYICLTFALLLALPTLVRKFWRTKVIKALLDLFNVGNLFTLSILFFSFKKQEILDKLNELSQSDYLIDNKLNNNKIYTNLKNWINWILLIKNYLTNTFYT